MNQYVILNKDGLFLQHNATFGPPESAWRYDDIEGAYDDCAFHVGEYIARVQVSLVVLEEIKGFLDERDLG